MMAKQILGWSATTWWSFMPIPIVNSLVMYYVIPPLIARFGVHALITYSSIGTMITLGAFAVPAVHTSPAGVMLVTVCLVLCVVTVQVPNQMRIKLIADAFAPEAMGKITGASRVCFAVGQTLSPIVVAVLYTIHLVSDRVDVSRRGDRTHRVLPVWAGILRGPGREGGERAAAWARQKTRQKETRRFSKRRRRVNVAIDASETGRAAHCTVMCRACVVYTCRDVL